MTDHVTEHTPCGTCGVPAGEHASDELGHLICPRQPTTPFQPVEP